VKKTRLDLALLGRGLASTRSKAQDLIREGKALLNGTPCLRPGAPVGDTDLVSLLADEHPYVSRGGLKLEHALTHFGIDLRGERVLDIGQSTGGFTHCLLLRGAREVVGIEVGHGQLAAPLRADSRVRCLEGQDIRKLSPEQAGETFRFFVADLSFISLTLVLPCVPPFLRDGSQGVVLVKPQFEVGPEGIGSGGIVRDAETRERGVQRVVESSRKIGFSVRGLIPSSIRGGDGNEEALIHLEWHSSPAEN
jgi:23S rRNA (cytidine1920-2'-O)/16S rRNA (cytidine1409-2'-O)-methyltransferase